MATSSETYTFQGETFELKPRTKANIDAVHEIIQENTRKRNELVDWTQERIEELYEDEDNPEVDKEALREQAEEQLGYHEVSGEFEIRFDIFRAALDGPHSEIDHSALTWPELEEVRTDFLPQQMQILNGQNVS